MFTIQQSIRPKFTKNCRLVLEKLSWHVYTMGKLFRNLVKKGRDIFLRSEHLDLHGLNLAEAMEKLQKSLTWSISHEVEVLDINHGKGHHSNRNFSVIKSEIRKILKESTIIPDNGYKVIYGESSFPVALTFDEGHTLIVRRGCENKYLGDSKQTAKYMEIYSDEGRKKRKLARNQQAYKRRKK